MITIEHTGATSAVFRSREAQVIVRPGTRSYIEYSGMREWVSKLKDMRVVDRVKEVVPEPILEPILESIPEPIPEPIPAVVVEPEVITEPEIASEPVVDWFFII